MNDFLLKGNNQTFHSLTLQRSQKNKQVRSKSWHPKCIFSHKVISAVVLVFALYSYPFPYLTSLNRTKSY